MKSNSSNGPGEWAEENSRRMRELLGRVRRMAVRLTSRSTWQVIGHLLLDGTTETRDAEVFSGIGFYARPKDNGRSEAIVEFVGGGAGQPVVIATRDEDTRKKVAGDLKENETQMHNDLAVMRIKADGTIEARSAAGVATKLATLADLQALRDFVYNQFGATGGHVHATPSGPTTGITTSNAATTAPSPAAPANPIGTTKFKAE